MTERKVVTPDPADVRAAVQRHYDVDPGREWERADRHRTEFAITWRALERCLPPPPARVLDCGGGPGRYALELARRGYRVTLFDLSPGNLAFAQQKAAEAGVSIASIEQGTALDLSRFADDSFDAVLLMGPLYHLLEAEERRQALAEAARVAAPGGPVFAAFIARYAAHIDATLKFPQEPVEIPGLYETVEDAGLLPPRDGSDFAAYFARPAEAVDLCWGAGLEVVDFLNVEGIAAGVESRGFNDMTGPAWEWWTDLNWRLAAEPSLLGAACHYLAVTRKPAWRRVLADLARRLDAAGVVFKVVGSASLALHGYPLVVPDIDIETDQAGAYRFQELFAAHAVEPVAYREGEHYRSHFGRFSFDGVKVEVMSDLEWKDEDEWRFIHEMTEAIVAVEGTRVRVPWPEEEILAYIRRGRLDRAAFCLPRCDQQRLLALIRGTVKPGVI